MTNEQTARGKLVKWQRHKDADCDCASHRAMRAEVLGKLKRQQRQSKRRK